MISTESYKRQEQDSGLPTHKAVDKLDEVEFSIYKLSLTTSKSTDDVETENTSHDLEVVPLKRNDTSYNMDPQRFEMAVAA